MTPTDGNTVLNAAGNYDIGGFPLRVDVLCEKLVYTQQIVLALVLCTFT